VATYLNSSKLANPSGKIISAPASMYFFDLEIVDSMPSTPLASVRAQIMN